MWRRTSTDCKRKNYLTSAFYTSPSLFLVQMATKLCGEKDDTIKELLNIKQAKCSVEIFRNVAKQAGYQIMNEQLYLFNPHYEVKFGFPPRKLSKGISMIPYVRDFFSTSCFI